MEFTLLFAALTGVAGIWVTGRVLGRLGLLPEWLDRPTDVLVGAAVIGLATGRVAAMIGDGVNPFSSDLLIVRAGVDTGFASLGALVALGCSVRRRIPETLDAMAPMAVAGLAGWHLGCIWRSACLGTASNLPWTVAQPGSDITRHPVEIYAALALAGLVWGLTLLPARRWLATGVALAGVAGVRLATEPLRLSLGGGPVGWYLTGLLGGLALAAVGPRLIGTRSPPTGQDRS